MRFRKQKEIAGHSAGIYSLAFDELFLYSASADKYIARWNLETCVQDKFAIQFESSVYSCLLIKEKHFLIAGLSTGDIHIFDLEERKEIKFFTQHESALFVLKENSIRKHFYAADADGNLSIWNSENLNLLLYFPLNCGKIRRISMNQDGSLICLSCQDGKIRILDTEFYNELYCIDAHKDGVTAAVFCPNESDEIITGGKDAMIRKWNFKSGQLMSDIPAHNYVVYELMILNDGKTLVSASRDKTMKIFDLSTMSFIQRLDHKEGGHKHSVNCILKMSESTFVSASDDKRMIIWEAI